MRAVIWVGDVLYEYHERMGGEYKDKQASKLGRADYGDGFFCLSLLLSYLSTYTLDDLHDGASALRFR